MTVWLEIRGVTHDWRCEKCGGKVERREHYICTGCMTIFLARILPPEPPPSWECIFCRQLNPIDANACWCGKARYEWPPSP